MLRASESVVRLPRRRLFSALELHAFTIGSIAAVVFFIGWGLNVEFLQNLIPGFPSMKPLTAFSFMMLSLSCIMSLRGSRRSRIGSSLIAGGTILWVIFLILRNWGVDGDGESAIVPAQATLISLILAGSAMLIVNLAPKAQAAAAIMVWLALVPALFRILSLLLFWGSPVQSGSFLSSMAIHTAILIVWFMTCVLLHPRLSYAEALFQPSLRGRLLRVALPISIALPVLAAVASLVLARMAGWQDEALFALDAAISVIIGATLIWRLSVFVANWQIEANAQASRLERANEALEQYASSAAHDLKAPARHVLLYGELLQEALEKGDAAGAKKFAANIRSAAAELPPMIEGMLEYSRSGYTQLKPEDGSLSELVQAAAALQEADLKAAGAKVFVEREAVLWCDAQLMTAVFQNLIANSLKHRRKDRPLEIRIDVERVDDPAPGRWEITVTDNGVGFAPEFAAVAFNPLARGVKLAGEGAGIGLATCRTILTTHGGEIRVDPTFRDGARIEITLPAKP